MPHEKGEEAVPKAGGAHFQASASPAQLEHGCSVWERCLVMFADLSG